MQAKRFAPTMIAAVSGLLWTAAAGAAAQHQHAPPAHSRPAERASAPEKAEDMLKVGKQGDVEFAVETLVGEMRLNPGRYVLEHRVDGSDHFVHFTEVAKPVSPGAMGGGATKAHPGEVKCGLEPLEKKVKQTTVYTAKEGEARRVTKVLIRGENVAHVF